MSYRPLAQRHATAMAMADRLRSLARDQTENAFNTIISIMVAPTTSDRDKLTAAFGVLDRGWGKPKEVFEAMEGPMRRIVREIVHVTETREELEQELEQTDLTVDFEEIKTNGHGNS